MANCGLATLEIRDGGGWSSSVSIGNTAIASGGSGLAVGSYCISSGTYTTSGSYSGTFLDYSKMSLEELEEHFDFCENNHNDHVTFRDQYEVVEDINKRLIKMPFGGFTEE